MKPITTVFTTRPELAGTFGMISTTHWLASAVGMAALERGGNAFDAAVSAGFMLQVCEPHLNGPGGDLPAIFYSASDKRTRVLCGQGTAPRRATIEHFRGLDFEQMPGTGLLATVVPGVFDGWLTLFRDYGSLRLEDILAPAISYLEHGCPLIPKARLAIEHLAPFFEKHWPSSARQWLPFRLSHGAASEVYTNLALAATYRRILGESASAKTRVGAIEAARQSWKQGFVCAAIDEFMRSAEAMDTSGRVQRGVIDGDDIAQWQASYEDPLELAWRNYTVYKAGFWSQGPVFLQQLSILRRFEFSRLDPIGPDFVHILTEAGKLAFADRDGFYADPRAGGPPLDGLLTQEYGDQRAKMISNIASIEFVPGILDGRPGWLDRDAVARGGRAIDIDVQMGFGEPTVRCDRGLAGDTCHIDVADRWGNMVSATPSGGWLQSSPTIPALGFCLNTRAQMFVLDPASPAALRPGMRPRTTLSPSFALRDGKPYLAFGTPGGDQQDQWALQFFLRHVELNFNLQQAIDAPSFTSEHFPSSFWPKPAFPKRLILEGRFPKRTIDELSRRGHDVAVGPEWSLARLCAVSRTGSLLRSGANPRGMQAYAVGR